MAQDRAIIKIQRFAPEVDAAPYFDSYTVPLRKGMTVLDGLFEVLDQQDGSLAFRASCRGAICGSDAMYINGAFRLACNTAVAWLVDHEGEAEAYALISDAQKAVVHMEPFWRA